MSGGKDDSFHGLVGDCPSLRKTKSILGRFRRCEASVLILGENGTGKELVARAIHTISSRAIGPFVPVNCGALPDDLLENELFGHEQGAFTGARDRTRGLVEQADSGTLFLDEIGSLSLKGQCALLRFLQSKEFRRLGSDRLRCSDVRVISATNADLTTMVSNGEFRKDLLYRLNILKIVLPALRERGTDLYLLTDYFISRFCDEYQISPKSLDAEASNWLHRHDWPGNIRELENSIHRAVLTAPGDTIRLEDIVGDFEQYEISPPDGSVFSMRFQDAKAEAISRFERHYLEALMRHCKGNISEAARMAGKERRSLGKLVKKYDIKCHYADSN